MNRIIFCAFVYQTAATISLGAMRWRTFFPFRYFLLLAVGFFQFVCFFFRLIIFIRSIYEQHQTIKISKEKNTHKKNGTWFDFTSVSNNYIFCVNNKCFWTIAIKRNGKKRKKLNRNAFTFTKCIPIYRVNLSTGERSKTNWTVFFT